MRNDYLRSARTVRRCDALMRALVPVLITLVSVAPLVFLAGPPAREVEAAAVTTPQTGPADTPVVLVRWWKQSQEHPDGAIGMEVSGDYVVEVVPGPPPYTRYVFGPGGGSITILYEDERDNETVLMGEGDKAYEDEDAYYADV